MAAPKFESHPTRALTPGSGIGSSNMYSQGREYVPSIAILPACPVSGVDNWDLQTTHPNHGKGDPEELGKPALARHPTRTKCIPIQTPAKVMDNSSANLPIEAT